MRLTFVHLVEQLEVLQHRQAWAAKASLEFDEIDVGDGQAGTLERLVGRRHRAEPMIAGSTPPRPWSDHRHRLDAQVLGRWADITIMQEAPSVICEEVPAVTVPPFGLNAGFQLGQGLDGGFRTNGLVEVEDFRKPFSSYPSIGMIVL